MKKIELLFDTDAGSDCDDMMALAYLAYAEKNLNVDIRCFEDNARCSIYSRCRR